MWSVRCALSPSGGDLRADRPGVAWWDARSCPRRGRNQVLIDWFRGR
ncbi:hypothetical protein HBB16_02765 [Pseudonocardia sp. MCCB 268]|nr:hypothetical protein [Pseudonocardia cytotoxica]